MKLGVAMAFGETPVPGIASWAAAAEERGAGSVWLGEAWRELSVPLCATALATDRSRVAAGVMQLFPAHPVIAALQAAQLQEVSGGRFALGLGLGAGFVVERWFGLPYERPLRRAREFVEVVRGVLASRHGEPFSYSGEIFDVRGYRMRFGADLPDVPILLAAVGPRMLELAGEVADGVVLGAVHSPDYISEVRRRLDAGAERAGRDPAEVKIHAFTLGAVTGSPEQARELARSSIAYSMQYAHYQRRWQEEGLGEVAEEVAACVRAHDQTRALELVSAEVVERFAIAGTAAECRAQLERRGEGIDETVLTLVPFRTDEGEVAERLLDAVGALAAADFGSAVPSR